MGVLIAACFSGEGLFKECTLAFCHSTICYSCNLKEHEY